MFKLFKRILYDFKVSNFSIIRSYTKIWIDLSWSLQKMTSKNFHNLFAKCRSLLFKKITTSSSYFTFDEGWLNSHLHHAPSMLIKSYHVNCKYLAEFLLIRSLGNLIVLALMKGLIENFINHYLVRILSMNIILCYSNSYKEIIMPSI